MASKLAVRSRSKPVAVFITNTIPFGSHSIFTSVPCNCVSPVRRSQPRAGEPKDLSTASSYLCRLASAVARLCRMLFGCLIAAICSWYLNRLSSDSACFELVRQYLISRPAPAFARVLEVILMQVELAQHVREIVLPRRLIKTRFNEAIDSSTPLPVTRLTNARRLYDSGKSGRSSIAFCKCSRILATAPA